MVAATAAVLRDGRGVAVEEVVLDGPEDGELLIDIHTASLCHSDLSVITGDRPRPRPMVLGHEASGVVRRVGAGVAHWRPGDSALLTFVPSCGACDQCRDGRPALCGPGNAANAAGELLTGRRPFTDASGAPVHQHLGVSAFSTSTVVAAESAVPLPVDMPLDHAALLGCAVLTGAGAVLNTASFRAGERIAVFGCGGVGLAAILGAQAAGAGEVIAVDAVEASVERAVALGATHGLMAGPDTAETILELTRGGVDAAIDATGAVAAIAQAYACTRAGGTTVVVGLAPPAARLELNLTDLVARERILRGSYMGSAVPARDVPRMIALYRAGRLPLEALIADRIQLADIGNGFDRLASGIPGRQLIQFQES